MNLVGAYKVSEMAKLPIKGTELAACYDVYACLHEKYVKFYKKDYYHENVRQFGTEYSRINLLPGDVALIPTGLIFTIPFSHHLKFYSRSGMAWKNKVTVLNAPAVIDADYTHESFVILYNGSEDIYSVNNGDAIAQCELCKNTDITFYDIEKKVFDDHVNIVNQYSSRNGGLGSTGK